eukprot:1531233-Prymnesium_polylepis.2
MPSSSHDASVPTLHFDSADAGIEGCGAGANVRSFSSIVVIGGGATSGGAKSGGCATTGGTKSAGGAESGGDVAGGGVSWTGGVSIAGAISTASGISKIGGGRTASANGTSCAAM